MNLKKLKQAETEFFKKFPEGFNDPHMCEIAKKHKMDKMTQFARDSFAKKSFDDTDAVIDNMIKIISRSSMVSLFEKPKFKDFAKSLNAQEKDFLAAGLKKRLHGKEEAGFEMILEIMNLGKMAKWSLITIIPAYFNPKFEVFVKPTTAKGVIGQFELETLVYNSKPSWAFYQEYRKIINEMKSKVDHSLSPSNAAFSGFLMMSL